MIMITFVRLWQYYMSTGQQDLRKKVDMSLTMWTETEIPPEACHILQAQTLKKFLCLNEIIVRRSYVHEHVS